MFEIKINHLIDENLRLLQSKGLETSRFELKVLIAHILKTEPKNLSGQQKLNEKQIDILNNMISQRLKHCPVDKIVGYKGFYKYDFIVNEKVLSPRADTEILVEKAIEILSDLNNPRILEFGVGSGCIILSILADISHATGVGIDISEDALAIAASNSEKLNISEKRLKLLKADWHNNDIRDQLSQSAPFDMIVSNPPYIPRDEIKNLDEEVRNYDPHIALDGGEDGLRDYAVIIDLAHNLLKDKGFLILEAGDYSQLKKISLIAQTFGLKTVKIMKDLSGQERCIILKK